MKKCPICLNSFVDLHKHHVVPKCYNGDRNGYLLEICGSCHNQLHAQAEAEFRYVNSNNFEKLKKEKFPEYLVGDRRERASPYIKAIITAKTNYLQATDTDDVPKKLFLEVPNKVLVQMHKRKASLGFKSMENYVLHLISQDIKNL